jgi:hypothetical protein
MPGYTSKTRGTPKQRAKQRAAKSKKNKAAAAKQRKAIGRSYVPNENAADLKNFRVVDDATLAVRRGDKSDEQCVEEILEFIGCGWTARKSAALVGINERTWIRWKAADRFDLQKRFVVAKQLQAEAWEEDLIDDADSATQEDYQAPKLRITTKQWIMGKHHVRYGDKSTHVIEGGENPVRTITSEMSPAEAAALWQEELLKNKQGG